MNERITYDEKILRGKPIIRGLRIPVDLILRMLGQGVHEAEILQEYPDLEHEDIIAAINYAGKIVSAEEFYPVHT